MAFFEGKGFRNFCDSLPSALSPVANLICNYPIKTRTVIAHVRMATQGKVRLENVHPFTRELWGRCVRACVRGCVFSRQLMIAGGVVGVF